MVRGISVGLLALALSFASSCGSDDEGGEPTPLPPVAGAIPPGAGTPPSEGACPEGLTLCADDTPSCEDLQSSGGNCGACNVRCPSGADCRNGACVAGGGTAPDAGTTPGFCPPGLTLCPDDDSPSCEDLQSSGGNCGACNNNCPSGTNCRNGSCRP